MSTSAAPPGRANGVAGTPAVSRLLGLAVVTWVLKDLDARLSNGRPRLTREEFDTFVTELAPVLEGPGLSAEERLDTRRILDRVRSRVAAWQDDAEPAVRRARAES